MYHLRRFALVGAFALTAVTVYGQNSPPVAPAPGRVVPASPEAALSTSAAPARNVRTPAGKPTPDAPNARADAEHQAARARCEVHPKSDQATCLREADAAYERALAGQKLGQQSSPGSSAGATGTGKG